MAPLGELLTTCPLQRPWASQSMQRPLAGYRFTVPNTHKLCHLPSPGCSPPPTIKQRYISYMCVYVYKHIHKIYHSGFARLSRQLHTFVSWVLGKICGTPKVLEKWCLRLTVMAKPLQILERNSCLPRCFLPAEHSGPQCGSGCRKEQRSSFSSVDPASSWESAGLWQQQSGEVEVVKTTICSWVLNAPSTSYVIFFLV